MAVDNPYKRNPKTDFRNIDELSEDEAAEQVNKLRNAIDFHDYKYYVENDPVISDTVYDKLFHRLQDLEEKFPELKDDNSPTRRVGTEPVDELGKVEHQGAMLSLDSTLEDDKIKNFIKNIKDRLDIKDDIAEKMEMYLEPKLDGLSVEIVYEDGEFKYGATRGDGQRGDDISENLRTVNSIPLKLRENSEGTTPGYLAVRGELLMLRDGFQELNKKRIEQNKDPYANPRNAAAGTVRQLDSSKVADKALDIYFYDILDSEGLEAETQQKIYELMPKLGLKVNDQTKLISGESCDEIYDKIKTYREEIRQKREDLNYQIDGIVIKLDKLDLRDELGIRERSPRWAAAWKFPPKKDLTTLKDIVIQVGRTGMLTPVALLEPVDVDGVTVSRATLHNEDEVRKKNVHPGDKVKIKRAGDVIPEVIGRAGEDEDKSSDQEKFNMPDQCPVCGTKVVREGAYYFCPNGLSCKAQLVGSIEHYASRQAADINHLGEEVAGQLVEEGLIENLADIYYLKEEDILELPGFAKKSTDNLLSAIENSKVLRLDRFLYALGIRHVGTHMARVLAENYNSLDELRNADKSDLKNIDEIGDKIAESIYIFFREEKNLGSISRMKEAGLELKSLDLEGNLPLKGETYVFTGRLDNYTRDEAMDMVENLGAEATTDVSGETDYLVVGEDPGSKLEKAEEFDIEIIDEDEFRDRICQ
ncbi:MAG: NAD-dependent DNA ligase LigA [Halanaerobiales bacterium]